MDDNRDTCKKVSMAEEKEVKAEDSKEEAAPPTTEETQKLVAYKLLQPLGANVIGDVIHLPEDLGQKLIEAEHAELAVLEDMAQATEDNEDNAEYADEPVLANSTKRIAKEIEKKMAENIAQKMETKPEVDTNNTETVSATPKAPAFRSNGEYIRCIAKAVSAQNKGQTISSSDQNRIVAWQEMAADKYDKMGLPIEKKSILGINETTNATGGYLVNPEFSPDVYTIDHGQLDLVAQCKQIGAKGLIYNQRYINESSLANGSIFGGLNMVATAEGASFTSSLPAWGNVAYQLQKFAIFVYYTTEVLEDASYPVESEVDEYCNKAFLYGLNTQVFQGSTLEGLLNAPSLVTVTSSTNDTAFHTTPQTSLTYADIANIWASVYPESQGRGIWLFHPSLVNPITQMTFTFSGSTPAWGIQYDAQQGLVGQGMMTPYRLFGRPAYPSWACSAPGAAGDIAFVDFSTFLAYKKPFRVEVSKDYQFGTDQIAVRFVARLDCKTRFRNKITGPTGSQQFSSIVTRSGSGT
jgi:HK97 family phage major capsid protein